MAGALVGEVARSRQSTICVEIPPKFETTVTLSKEPANWLSQGRRDRLRINGTPTGNGSRTHPPRLRLVALVVGAVGLIYGLLAAEGYLRPKPDAEPDEGDGTGLSARVAGCAIRSRKLDYGEETYRIKNSIPVLRVTSSQETVQL